MLIKKNLAQNEHFDIAFKTGIDSVAIQTAAGANAGATFKISVSFDGGTEFVDADLQDVADPLGATVATLVGPSKAGYAHLPGADVVRVTRTDAAGGDGTVAGTMMKVHS